MNKYIKITCKIVFIVVFHINGANAQGLIDHKLDVGLRVGTAFGLESEPYISDEFIAPSLLNHMNNSSKIDFIISYNVHQFFSVNAIVSSTNFSNWNGLADNNMYEGTTTDFILFHPGIIFHTPWRRQGFLNRFKAGLTISAALGNQTIYYGNRIQNDQKSTIGNNGFSTELSINYSFAQSIFAHISYGINQLNNNSEISPQKSYRFQYVSIGIGIQIFKNKMYLYE